MRRKATAPVFLLAFAACTWAFPPPGGGNGDHLDGLAGRALTRPVIDQLAPRLLDEIGGRRMGTPSAEAAVDFAAAALRSLGVPLVSLESFEAEVWEADEVGADLCVGELTYKIPNVLPLIRCASTGEVPVRAEVVDCGYGTPEEIEELGDALGGKVVLAAVGAPEGKGWVHRSKKYKAAAEAGAVAFVLMPRSEEDLPRIGTAWFGEGEGPIPAVSIPYHVGARIRRLINRGLKPELSISVSATTRSVTASNVVGVIPGRNPDEKVMVVAHLDSWDLGEGAGDNGTGTLVLWQVADAIAHMETRPLRSVVFVEFMGEELGLLGSRAYVERHKDELSGVVALVNLDMVGDPTGFWSSLQEQADPFLSELAKRLAGFGLSEEITHGVWFASDHAPFLLAGVPVMGLRSNMPKELGRAYHTELDNIDHVDFGQLHRAAAVVAALVWELANTQDPPTITRTPEQVSALLEEAGKELPVWAPEILGGEQETH